MKRHELLQALLSTADDSELSRGERTALRAVLSDADPSASTRDALAHDLVEALTDKASDPRDAAQLRWLGDTLRILLSGTQPEHASRAWFGPGDPMVEALLATLGATRTSLDAAVFTITDDRITEQIVAMHERGVKVRLLTDNDKAEDRGSDAHRLRRAGVPIRFDRSDHHFHHKFAVLDGERLINGSYNWTRSADRHNRENFSLTTDGVLVRQYSAAFDEMWAELG